MKIFNGINLSNGAKADHTRLFGVSQPLQFIPKSEKDDEWAAWNMDWLEWQGLKQIRSNSRRLLKNYKLAKGEIDRSDYIVEETNDMKDLVETLTSNDEVEALELKFYPIIPNVINTLVSEFAKRDKKVSFRAMDEFTHNQILDQKKADLENILVKQAEQKMMMQMIEQGLDMSDPENKKMAEEKMKPENLKTLPELEDFYSKSYEVISEKWATKQYAVDEERFHMEELEEVAFKDKLITDREFWHFQMYEDDYNIELWNPITTFYHKSSKEKYISNAQFVGHIEIMTVADVIDNYGWNMTEEQMMYLQDRFLNDTPGYNIGGYQNDGSFYDSSKSYEWNTQGPSLEYRQMVNGMNLRKSENDIIGMVLSESEDGFFYNESNMFRVTTAYWKTQMKVGHLTKVDDDGSVIVDIVSEDYKVTTKPQYNTTLYKQKSASNLIYGEHIDWIWINQVWGGVKIGPNAPTMYGTDNIVGVNPIYLGINQNKIGPLKFQFKGDKTLYGCKLPVEGCIFNYRNTKSSSLVDSMKPFQIGYNIVNNQISDILIDEIGTVIMLDQNALPKHSMGEDWGKGNLAKAYVAMKDFSILPVDSSITNTENALNFQHYQQLDLSQTQRLQSRIQLAQYFKQQAFEQVGVNQQRMGQAVGQRTTATEIEQIQAGAYAQTEMHFVEHSDYLMPRVHQMRTDLAQWYNSTKPSIKLQLTTSNDERVNFEINGEDLLLSDLNVYCQTKTSFRQLHEQLKQLALNNNTAGMSIYDIGSVLQTSSLGALNSALKAIDEKAQKQRQEQMQHEQQMQDAKIEAEQKEKQMEFDHEVYIQEMKNRMNIQVAEIKASGYAGAMDFNQNNQSDFIDNMEKIKRSENYQEAIRVQDDQIENSKRQAQEAASLKREQMQHEKEMKEMDYAIAAKNKNKWDFPQQTKKEEKKKDKEK